MSLLIQAGIGLVIGSAVGYGLRMLRAGAVFNPDDRIPSEMRNSWEQACDTVDNIDFDDYQEETARFASGERGLPHD